MPDLTLRTFDVCYEAPSLAAANSTSRFDKRVDAAYFQQGLGVGEDSDAFVVFKDCQHKPVFTVRATSVVTIEEIRDEQSSLLAPEMQARALGPSGYGSSIGYTTVVTLGGTATVQQAGTDNCADE